MGVIEILIIISIVVGGWRGYFTGLSGGIATTLGMLIGIIACRIFGDVAYEMLCAMSDAENWEGAPLSGMILAYFVVFAIVYVSCMAFGGTLRQIIRSIHLSAVDRLCGVAFGAIKYLLMASVVLNLIFSLKPSLSIFPGSDLQQNVMEFAPWLWGIASQLL